MEDFQLLFTNPWLWTALLSMGIAQILKIVLVFFIDGVWKPSLMLETGGMPSSHTAFVSALCTSLGYTEGLGSPLFAMSVVFSIIVMYDATGVRRSSGQQAKLLNELIAEMQDVVKEGFAPKPLRVLLGHTYTEVLGGLILGIVVALAVFVWF